MESPKKMKIETIYKCFSNCYRLSIHSNIAAHANVVGFLLTAALCIRTCSLCVPFQRVKFQSCKKVMGTQWFSNNFDAIFNPFKNDNKKCSKFNFALLSKTNFIITISLLKHLVNIENNNQIIFIIP